MQLTVTTRRVHSRVLASPLILIYTFAGLITIGTVLLLLPFTHHGGGFTSFIDALFTAISAVTVTGLVVQDTATYWTRAGQAVILGLIFVGGLGFMTIASFLLILMGHRFSLTQGLLVKDNLQIDQLTGLARLTVRIVLLAAGMQLVGFIALAVRFSSLAEYAPAEAVWQAAFHAVSAFNGAGFVTLPEGESLSAFRQDKVVLGIMAGLIFLGAIGYWAIVEVARRRRFALYTLNTKLVLILTLALLLSGALVFFFSEYDNTLRTLNLGDKVTVSVFESISGRTAGFSTVSYDQTEQHTNVFFTSLMFIGGASASVAGGIKVNTLAVVLVAVISSIRGSSRASAFGREIPQAQVQRATTIAAVAIAMVFLVALMLTFSESEKDFSFIDLLFESVSAFGTVGLTTGLTADLTRWGHLILIASMFAGRIGPLSLVLAMAQQREVDLYRYAKERVTLG